MSHKEYLIRECKAFCLRKEIDFKQDGDIFTINYVTIKGFKNMYQFLIDLGM